MLNSKALIFVSSFGIAAAYATAKPVPSPLQLPVGELNTMLKTVALGQGCTVGATQLTTVGGATTLSFTLAKQATQIAATLQQMPDRANGPWSVQKGVDAIAGVPYWRFRLAEQAVQPIVDDAAADDGAPAGGAVLAWDWEVRGAQARSTAFRLTVGDARGDGHTTTIDCSIVAMPAPR